MQRDYQFVYPDRDLLIFITLLPCGVLSLAYSDIRYQENH